MSEERPKAVAALPWLQIEREAKVGDIRFVPFDIGSPPDLTDSNEVSRRLSIFRRIEREFERDDKWGMPLPKSTCTIIMLDGQGPLGVFTEDDWTEVIDAIQAFCFACLAANKYRTSAGQGPYANSSCFQVYYLADSPVFALRGRGICVLSNWNYEMLVVTEPLQCGLARDLDWDDVFLSSLWCAMKTPPNSLDTLTQAIWLFNRANSDEQRYAIEQIQQEVVMIVQALEYLFDSKGESLAAKVANCFPTDGEIQCRPPRVGGSWIGTFNISNRRCVYYWLRELIQLRHDTVHGNPLSSKRWAWAVDEHALMAAFVFPLIVKCFLADEGVYRLTEKDKVRLGVIDKLLYMNHWGTEEGETQSNWSNLFLNAKNKRLKEQRLS